MEKKPVVNVAVVMPEQLWGAIEQMAEQYGLAPLEMIQEAMCAYDWDVWLALVKPGDTPGEDA